MVTLELEGGFGEGQLEQIYDETLQVLSPVGLEMSKFADRLGELGLPVGQADGLKTEVLDNLPPRLC